MRKLAEKAGCQLVRLMGRKASCHYTSTPLIDVKDI